MSAESPSKAGDGIAEMKAYTDGKLMRLNLLFSVNGGAFAIAKVLFVEHSAGPNSSQVLGGLSLQALALGMSAFTVAMCFDLWVYGNIMRNTIYKHALGRPGKVVVGLIGSLLVAGWLLAAGWPWKVVFGLIVSLLLAGWLWDYFGDALARRFRMLWARYRASPSSRTT